MIYLENQGVALDRVENGIVFYGDDLFYPSDFLLDGTIVIEIKSSYIQNLQEAKRPGCLQAKKELVERHGFSFIYVLDKDYSVITEYL